MTWRKQFNRSQLHEDVAKVLRREILENGKPGQRLDSESTMAKRFNVSVITVREALRSLAQEGFVTRRHGSGTYIADWTAGQHIAVLCLLDLGQPRVSYFYLRSAQALMDYFPKQGMQVRLYAGNYLAPERPVQLNCPAFWEDLEAHKIKGVLALYAAQEGSWLEALAKQRIPVVGGSDPAYDCMVNMDIGDAVRNATHHLLDEGCRRIAYLGMKHRWSNEDMLLDAYKSVLSEAGVPFDESLIRHDLHPSQAGAGWEEFRGIWLGNDPKPDGLVISEDGLFQDAITAMLELGISVPKDLKIATLTNQGSGILAPFPVTRFECNPADYAERMGELLLRLINRDPTVEKKILIPMEKHAARTFGFEPRERAANMETPITGG